MDIVQLIPCPVGFRAVFASPGGPTFKPVACVALVRDGYGVRVAPVSTAFADWGGLALFLANEDPMFLGCIGPGEDASIFLSRNQEFARDLS
jgi:hypothetical protein